MARRPITIVLELDGSVDSPFGTAGLPDGIRRSFHGWLALAAAIDELAASTVTAEAPAPTGLPVMPTQEPEVQST
jgi:hypothetical protein